MPLFCGKLFLANQSPWKPVCSNTSKEKLFSVFKLGFTVLCLVFMMTKMVWKRFQKWLRNITMFETAFSIWNLSQKRVIMFPSKLLLFIWQRNFSDEKNSKHMELLLKTSCTSTSWRKRAIYGLIRIRNVGHFFLFPFSWDVAPADATVIAVFAGLLACVFLFL